MSNVRERIVSYVDRHKAEWEEIALAIHAKPEVSNYEFFASETLSNKLKENGFEVELPAAGHRTGFAASYKSQKPARLFVSLRNTMPWLASATAADTIFSAHQAVLQAVL